MAVELKNHLMTNIRVFGPNHEDYIFLETALKRTERYLEEKERRKSLKSKLTPRETMVLELLAQGFQNKQVAQSLGIAINTEKKHTMAIRQKLDVGSSFEAILETVALGIIDLDKVTEGLDITAIRSLTLRELQTLRELANGAPTNKEIAAKHGTLEQTVKNHLSDITRKLGVDGSRIRAAMLYITAERRGLISSSY